MSIPKSLLIWVLLGVAASPGSRGAPVSFSCTFAEGGWDKDACFGENNGHNDFSVTSE